MLTFDWEWRSRVSPLKAKAVLGFENAAVQLLDLVEAIKDDAQRQSLQVTGFEKGVVVFGAEENLPWFVDAHYIGQDPQIPELWLPLHLMPNAPIDLIGAAFKRLYPAPFLLWPQPQKIIDLRRQFPVQSSILSLLRKKLGQNNCSQKRAENLQ